MTSDRSRLAVIFELSLAGIITLQSIRKNVGILSVTVGTRETKEGRGEQVCSHRAGSHTGGLPVKSQTCQHYWWTGQKWFLQVMLLIWFTGTCSRKSFCLSAWRCPNVPGTQTWSLNVLSIIWLKFKPPLHLLMWSAKDECSAPANSTDTKYFQQ